jgi:hypothetical protein
MGRPFFNDAVTAPVDMNSTGRIWGLRLINTTVAVAYLQVFDVPAAAVVLGTTKPSWVIALKASESLVWPMPEPADIANSASVPPRGLSIAGTTTATGAATAAISVSAIVS